jgi:hypothetical protein
MSVPRAPHAFGERPNPLEQMAGETRPGPTLLVQGAGDLPDQRGAHHGGGGGP